MCGDELAKWWHFDHIDRLAIGRVGLVIKNFDEVKKQLGELVEIVNGFKSEQVQLRVVEALLANMVSGGAAPASMHKEVPTPDVSPLRRRTARKSSAKSNGGEGAAKSSQKKTPKKAIEDLAADDYFAEHRIVSDVAEYLRVNRALTFKPATLQMALNRLVQDKVMQRGKNAQGQFEYWK
jgi:hypothetical protein